MTIRQDKLASLIQKLAGEFLKLENPSKQDFEDTLRKTAETLKIGPSDLIHPIRLAVSGVGGGREFLIYSISLVKKKLYQE